MVYTIFFVPGYVYLYRSPMRLYDMSGGLLQVLSRQIDIIDEVQKAPQLFEQIKIMCDESEEKGRFWLTGSRQFSMMKNIRDTLAGRYYAYAKAKSNLTYYRDSNAKEIDVFVEENNQIHPLEIKKSANPDRREVKKYALVDKTTLERAVAASSACARKFCP